MREIIKNLEYKIYVYIIILIYQYCIFGRNTRGKKVLKLKVNVNEIHTMKDFRNTHRHSRYIYKYIMKESLHNLSSYIISGYFCFINFVNI